MNESILATAVAQRYQEFTDNVCKLQKDEGMSDEAFGEYCEIGRTTWQRIRARSSGTNGLIMIRISVATGIPI